MMDPNVYATYAGVYQAYAWHQGYMNAPVTFRIPDEYFFFGPDVGDCGEKQGFILHEFMSVVSDMDSEGAIHYWRYHQADGDEFLTLVCTEDDSMVDLPNEDEYQRPAFFLESA